MSGDPDPIARSGLGALGRRSFLFGASASLLSACSFIPREPFTAGEQAIAEVPGIPNARVWVDGSEAEFRSFLRGTAIGSPNGPAESFDILALSGGAYDGAFGAGVIGGWTATGTRPKFVFVTGVSAGALIAPLAFLGPNYDAEMREAFSVDAAQVLGDLGGIFSLLGTVDLRHGMLENLVEKFVNERLMASVAAEHAQGRRLLILTTNLDAQRGVLWDMGAIAAGGPQYRQLFRDVLVASASIPGLFGPTYIEVHANGHFFREMHVDGGATSQFFVLPDFVYERGRSVAGPKKPAARLDRHEQSHHPAVRGCGIGAFADGFALFLDAHQERREERAAGDFELCWKRPVQPHIDRQRLRRVAGGQSKHPARVQQPLYGGALPLRL